MNLDELNMNSNRKAERQKKQKNRKTERQKYKKTTKRTQKASRGIQLRCTKMFIEQLQVNWIRKTKRKSDEQTERQKYKKC